MKTFLALAARVLPTVFTALLLASCAPMQMPMTSASAGDVPQFHVDAAWPQPLPEQNGVQLLFGQEGKLLRAWAPSGTGFDWPKVEHGIYIDDEGNVWLAGNAVGDNQILKFTQDGKFLMQIGHAGPTEGSNSQTQLGQPANMIVSKGELFVADGYGNHRVIVFDAKTGAYKRHWGAYGARPTDEKMPAYDPAQPLSRQFANPVHCVRMSHEDLLYVCDRTNNRIQVFTRAGEFKQEFRVEPQTMSNGSVWDMVLSQDAAQKYLYVGDGANGRIYILRRSDGQLLGQSAAPAAWPASSSGSTTWPSTARAISTRPRSGTGGACRSSCGAAAGSEPRLRTRAEAIGPRRHFDAVIARSLQK